MPSLTEETTIAASPERVFELLGRPERGPEWTPNLVRVERLSPGQPGPGSETRLVANVGGRMVRGRGRLLEWQPPRRIVAESEFEIGLSSVTTFEILPSEAGARVLARIEYHLPAGGLGRLLGGLLGEPLLRRDLRRALANLKVLLERSGGGD